MKILYLIIASFSFISFINAQVGKVGINTTTPSAMLHVKDSSVVFTYPFTLPASPGSPPVSGAGIRMMWYPEKAAFRAGRVSGTQWDKAQVGSTSVAMGFSTIASGSNSVAFGTDTKASGLASTAMGASTAASGNFSLATGGANTASGDNSTAMGHITKANSYSSLVIGQLNDTTSISRTEWNLLDPVFAIGIGEGSVRKNAMTVLKNGKTGIGTLSPQKLLHISGGSSGATPTSTAVGVFEDDTDVSINLVTPDTEESAIYFGNPTDARQAGITFNSSIAPDGLDFRTNGNITRAVISEVGNFGIGDNSPNARLHVNGGTGGGMYSPNSDLIIEDDDDAFLQFSTPDLRSGGILSGRTTTAVRSGILFQPDSSIVFRTGGNVPRLTLDKNGNTTLTGSEVVSGNSNVTGNITATGEVRRTSTGNANMVPICYGSISPGTPPVIQSGTGNFTVTNPNVGEYQITITGESYTNNGFSATVTPISSAFRSVSIGASGNNLVIRVWNNAFAQVDNHFHFVVYKN